MTHGLKLVCGLLALFSIGCAHGPSMGTLATQTKGKKVAIVSFSIADSSGALQGWNSADVNDLLAREVDKMLGIAEERLSERWELVPAQQFVGSPEYQSLAGTQQGAIVPMLDGHGLALKDYKDRRRARLAPDQAVALSRATGADLVAVIHSEWSVKTGSVVPTSKPIVITMVGIFDATGKERYHKYKMITGSRTLGAFGKAAVNEGTLGEWIATFDSGLSALMREP